ncbi:hypothetical protein SAMN05444722_0297 [Rhodovulum sp. ES.010]|uniref:hypothetical protein n=1 Tax=Rhodovulum sp. ES.010 TaxID=1882821 RepID=UPI000927761B|nr:hypothetical protein [Rhodovulum sp. ES.010]SIO06737.1 hypothetical protein SAMN05444722_0297 [Rhodovulum sp. ES.010]
MKRIRAAALVAATAGSTAQAQGCMEIRFAPGAYSGEVAGRVTDGAPLCFTFGSGAGQTARLELFGSENTCFAIPGVVDCQDDFSFRTAPTTYRVDVVQLFYAPAWEQFTLRLTIR